MPKYPEITIHINQHKDNPIAWITLCFQALSILNKQDEMNVLLIEISHKSSLEIRDIISTWFNVENEAQK